VKSYKLNVFKEKMKIKTKTYKIIMQEEITIIFIDSYSLSKHIKL